jgi:uncharacterized protein (DUF58 family)
MFKIKNSAIIFLIITFLMAKIGGWEIPHLIFYTVGGMMLVSALCSRNVARKLNAYQKIEQKDYYVDDELEISSFVENDAFFPIPHIEIVDRTEEAIAGNEIHPTITSILPMGREIIHKKIVAKYRGLYELGPIDVTMTDALGVMTRKQRIFSSIPVKVYPRIYNIESINLKSMQSYGTLTTKQKAFEDNSSVSDIKKYSPGESIKKMHWKISAKKGSLFVKNYEMTGSAATYIFLDFKRNSYKGENLRDLEERAVEAASSITSYLLKNSVSIEMYINSGNPYYTKGRDIKELNNFMNILCEIKTDGHRTMKDVLERRIRLISRGSSIIIITGDINYEESNIYGSIKAMGYDIILIYVGDYDLNKDIQMELDSFNIKLNVIKHDSDIKGVLESI